MSLLPFHRWLVRVIRIGLSHCVWVENAGAWLTRRGGAMVLLLWSVGGLDHRQLDCGQVCVF